jgi:hypothetical protein
VSYSDIDFSRRRPLPRWLFPAATLVVAALAAGVYRCVTIDQETVALKAQVASQRAQLLRRDETPAQPVPQLPKERAKAINEAIVSLNTPWPALLGAIESARSAKVALARVEPRPKEMSVLVTAQADDMNALLDFMNRMSTTAPFVRVRPVRQELVTEGGSLRKQATFEANWEERP